MNIYKKFNKKVLFCIIIAYLIMYNFVMGDDINQKDSTVNGNACLVEARCFTLPLCERSNSGTSITVVGVDYFDKINLFIKKEEESRYKYILDLPLNDKFLSKLERDDLSDSSALPMILVEKVEDFRDLFKKIEENFEGFIGINKYINEQHFFSVVANCGTDFSAYEFSTFKAVLRYFSPGKLLVKDFSNDIPENAVAFRLYSTDSGEVLDSILFYPHPYMFPMYASLAFGDSDNYIVVAERNVREKPVLSGIRLLRLNPLQSIKSIVFPYEDTFVTAISKPVSRSEVKISLSKHPYMVTCRVSSSSNDGPNMEIIEDCTPPVVPSCPFATNFQYFNPWITWITDENSYMLHFWNPVLGWYMIDLGPYTVFDNRYFPSYYYSSSASTLLLYQKKDNRPLFLLMPNIPEVFQDNSED